MTSGRAAPGDGPDAGVARPAAGYAVVVAAVAVAVLASLALAVAPLGAAVNESARVSRAPRRASTEGPSEPEAQPRRQVTRETLAESDGWLTVGMVAGPLLVLTAGPLLARRRRAAVAARGFCGVLLLAGAVLGALSVGIFYLPAAVLMLVAAGLALTTPRSRPHRVTLVLAGVALTGLLVASIPGSRVVAAVALPAAGFAVAAAIRAVIPSPAR